jgi:thiol-disulfide isomerase/thioredoxin
MAKVIIKIFTSTPTCPSCESEEPKAQRVAQKFPTGAVEVQKYESLSAEGEKYSIILTPAIVINDKVVAAGRGTAEKDLERMVRKAYDVKNMSV